MTGPIVGAGAAGVAWQVAYPEAIDWAEWGDEFVVRIGSQAETHLLSAAAGNALLVLLDGRPALTLEALFARAFGAGADAPPAAMSPGEAESLQAIVLEFERLGIVTRSHA